MGIRRSGGGGFSHFDQTRRGGETPPNLPKPSNPWRVGRPHPYNSEGRRHPYNTEEHKNYGI